jgi:hypothetical protein
MAALVSVSLGLKGYTAPRIEEEIFDILMHYFQFLDVEM